MELSFDGLLPIAKPDQLCLSAFSFSLFTVIYQSRCVMHLSSQIGPA